MQGRAITRNTVGFLTNPAIANARTATTAKFLYITALQALAHFGIDNELIFVPGEGKCKRFKLSETSLTMKHLLFLPFWLVATFSFGQNLSNKQKRDNLTTAKFNVVSRFLDLSPADIIADIGTGAGYSLIPIANNCPACKFIVEDIDSSTCNSRSLTRKINNSGNKTSINNFQFYYGTEKTTNLPSATFNKVLIFDVIHEMTYKTDMLNDIKRILQKNGSIFIEEILVHEPVKKDRVCNYPFLTEAAFKKLLADNKFLIKRESITFDTGNNKYIKIFECLPLP